MRSHYAMFWVDSHRFRFAVGNSPTKETPPSVEYLRCPFEIGATLAAHLVNAYFCRALPSDSERWAQHLPIG